MKLTILSEKKGVEYKYSCVMLEISNEIAKEVIEWGKKNIKEEDVYTDPEDPSLGREDHIHITVKYGLHSSDPACVSDLIKDFGSFDVKFDKVSKFESENYDVIKIAIKSDKLRKLNKLISDNTQVTDKYPQYNPHATIAYVKKGSCDHLLGNDAFADLSADCKEVTFFSKATGKKVETVLPIC